MKKTWVICLALVAVAAIVVGCIFGVQKGNMQKTVDDLTAQLNEKTGELETVKADLEKQLADTTAAAETAKADLEKQLADTAAAAETAKADLEKQLADTAAAAETVKADLEKQLADTAAAAEATKADLEKQLEEAKAGFHMPELKAPAANFADKYLAEGQRSVTDISVQAGDFLLSNIPEQARAGVKDLFQALKLEVVNQGKDGNRQGTVRLLLNDESALEATAAVGGEDYYVASNLLGNKIIRFTPEQIRTAVEKLTSQAVEQGSMTQEQADALKNLLNGSGLNVDMASLDLQPLKNALTKVFNVGIPPVTVTERPEEVTIDARSMVTVTVRKDALKDVMAEAGKLVWSIPAVQQMAGSGVVNGKPLTEENLIQGFQKFADLLADDVVIQVYVSADGKAGQGIGDVVLQNNGEKVNVHVNALLQTEGDETTLVWSARPTGAGTGDVLMSGSMKVVRGTNGGSMNYEVTLETTENGSTYTGMKETINAVWTEEENARSANLDVTMEIRTNAEANPVVVLITAQGESRDAGDHAETTLNVKTAVKDMGDVLGLTVQTRTDLAEAYIITEDAVQPLAMSQEDLQAFGQEITASAQSGLIALIGKLPQSTQQLVMMLMGGGMQ